MTYRQFWAVLVLVAAITVGRYVVGDRFVLAYFVIVGATGLFFTISYARGRARLHRHLAELSEEARERALVSLENVAFRAELAEELRQPMPRVPLRGGRELFRYPPQGVRISRWLARGYVFMSAFAAVGWLSDALLGREVFVGRETPWWETVVVIVGFAAGAGLTATVRR